MIRFPFRPTRGLVLTTILFVLGAPLAWSVVHARPIEPASAPASEPIGQAMKQMNDALKGLSKGITAETRDAQLEELAKFETAVIAAKSQVPDTAAKVEEKKRAAFVADYRKTLVEALRFACDAETAALEGKYKDADTIVRNKLSALKSTGHSKFKGEGGK